MLKHIYLAMHKVQMHAGAISKLLNVFASVRAIIHSLKARGLSSPYRRILIISTVMYDRNG